MNNKILVISSKINTINYFLDDTLSLLNKDNVVLLTNTKNNNFTSNFETINIPFKSKFNFFFDFYCLIVTTYFIFKFNPKLIITITPKIGFLVSLSSFFKSNYRIHFFTGQIWYNKKSINRYFFKLLDSITLSCSNYAYVDSSSQFNFLVSNGFNIDKLKLIHNGSICGVDTNVFVPNATLKKNFKKLYDINNNTKVLMFMGRVIKEKGIFTLFSVYKKILSNSLDFKLVIVGSDDENIIVNLKKNDPIFFSSIIYINEHKYPNLVLPCADVFALLSEREGFGLSVIQASSCSVPILGSNISGLQDSILDNNSGILIDINNIDREITKIFNFLKNSDLLVNMGRNGRSYVQTNFKKKDVINFIINDIQTTLKNLNF